MSDRKTAEKALMAARVVSVTTLLLGLIPLIGAWVSVTPGSPTSLPLVLTGAIGWILATALKANEKRIDEIEKQLRSQSR